MKQQFWFGPTMPLTPLSCLSGVLEPAYSFSAMSGVERIHYQPSLTKKTPTINHQKNPIPNKKHPHTRNQIRVFNLWMWFLIVFFKLKLVFPLKRNLQHFVLSTMSRFITPSCSFLSRNINQGSSRGWKALFQLHPQLQKRAASEKGTVLISFLEKSHVQPLCKHGLWNGVWDHDQSCP